MPRTKTTSDVPFYRHTQRIPHRWMLYVFAVVYFVLGWIDQDNSTGRWLAPVVGFLILFLVATKSQLTVCGQEQRLSIGFGPIPLFQKTVRYSDIESIESGNGVLLERWGVRLKMPDCIVLHLKKGVLRIGTDDAENLAEFLKRKISERGT